MMVPDDQRHRPWRGSDLMKTTAIRHLGPFVVGVSIFAVAGGNGAEGLVRLVALG
jgi:hypothetical protein